MPYGGAMHTKDGLEGDDATTAEQASDHIVEVINHAWLGMLLSLGERLGIHEVLAGAGPLTAEHAASHIGCDPRYLAEWLWAMSSTGIIRVGSTSDGESTFELAPAYVEPLTSAGGPGHWSRITTQVTAFAQLEDSLVGAFQTGGGLDSSHYEGRIAHVLAGESGPIFERVLLEEALPLTGLLTRLESGARVADLGCGTGSAALLLAHRFPKARILGIDQSATAISTARERAAQADITNVEFSTADLEDGFDLEPQDLILAANTAHDLSDPGRFFTRVFDSLADDGVFYLHELSASSDMRKNLDDPHALGILTFSLYHCLPLAKRRTGGIAPGGMWGRESYVDTLKQAGFPRIEVHRTASDPNNDTILSWKHAAGTVRN